MKAASNRREVGCAMCREWRSGGPLENPAVAVIAGYGLCARHLALVQAIKADGEGHVAAGRRGKAQMRVAV